MSSPASASAPLKISIVTATRNRVEFLPRCLDSVAEQPYPHKEHIIVDGASTDGTVALLQEYSARYPHIRWISEKDSSLSEAFNKGLVMVTGDVIGVIGDDDFYQPNVFGTIAEAFAAHPEAGMISGGCDFLRNDDSVAIRQQARFTNRHDLIACWQHWGRAVTLPAPSTFIRKQVIDTVGGFEEGDRYAMDYRHWIKITEKFSVVTVPQTFANFRYDDGNISFTQQQKQWQETLRISKEYWGSPLSLSYYRFLLSYLFHYQGGRVRGKLGRILRSR